MIEGDPASSSRVEESSTRTISTIRASTLCVPSLSVNGTFSASASSCSQKRLAWISRPSAGPHPGVAAELSAFHKNLLFERDRDRLAHGGIGHSSAFQCSNDFTRLRLPSGQNISSSPSLSLPVSIRPASTRLSSKR